MPQELLLVDFENVQQVNLLHLGDSTDVIIFVGATQVVEVLGKSEKKTRPRKLKTLSQYISSIFQKNIAKKDIDRIIDTLFAKK